MIFCSFLYTAFSLASHEDGLQREAKSGLRTLSPAALKGTGVSLLRGFFLCRLRDQPSCTLANGGRGKPDDLSVRLS